MGVIPIFRDIGQPNCGLSSSVEELLRLVIHKEVEALKVPRIPRDKTVYEQRSASEAALLMDGIVQDLNEVISTVQLAERHGLPVNTTRRYMNRLFQEGRVGRTLVKGSRGYHWKPKEVK